MDKRRNKKKKKNKFGLGLLVLIVALAIIIAIVLFALYKGLERFESTTPRAAIDDYFSLLAAEDYEQIKADSQFTPDEFNSWEDYTTFLHEQFGDTPGGYQYRQVGGGGEDGEQTYAVYDGEERIGEVVITPSESARHGYTVRASLNYLDSYTVKAPGYVTVSVNGAELPREGEGVAVTPIDIFDELPEDQRPTTIEYTLEPSLAEPAVVATDPNGVECTLTVDESARTMTVAVPVSEEQKAQWASQMEGAAKEYSLFISENGSWAAFNAYLYPGTQYATDVRSFQDVWYADHDSYAFNNMEVRNITPTSPTTFEGEIEFDFDVTFQGDVQTFHSHYRMAFAQHGDQWLLLNTQML